LFERDEIPPIVIYNISKYTLDEFNGKGEEFKGGTSIYAVKLLAHWINSFAQTNKFDIHCEILDDDAVNMQSNEIKDCMNNGGVIVARVWLAKDEHYVVITKMDEEYAYIFDPYYIDITTFDQDDDIEIIKYRKLNYNRAVKLSRVTSDTKNDYSIVNNENRQLLLINRVDNK
jgi:hypothetical protein